MTRNFPTHELTGKRVTVMGLGRFGGGVGAVRFLADRGARITLTDLLDEQALASSLAELGGRSMHALHLGGHVEADFSDADLVVASPAVPPDNRFLAIARAAGVPVTSEMNLFWQLNPAPVVGVTGSSGKSTTTAMIHSIFEAAGWKCRLGGNIGRSLLPEVHTIHSDEWVVLELSSFQLEDLDRIQASPRIAVVTNFAPNHLDRHGSLDQYRHAKQTILRWQREDDIAVLSADDSDVAGWRTRARRFGFGRLDDGGDGVFEGASLGLYRDDRREQPLPMSEWLTVPGGHNLQNAMAAACAALAAGIAPGAVQQGLRRFQALPHRLQLVGEAAGRKFYNDSKATTPEAARAALDAFTAPIVLLAGGYDKHVDLSLLARAIADRAKAVALMGQTAAGLFAQLDRANLPVRCCESLADAFRWAVEQTAPGDIVLLSPGCASYDWFRDYEERGDRFAEFSRDWCNHGSVAGSPPSVGEDIHSASANHEPRTTGN